METLDDVQWDPCLVLVGPEYWDDVPMLKKNPDSLVHLSIMDSRTQRHEKQRKLYSAEVAAQTAYPDGHLQILRSPRPVYRFELPQEAAFFTQNLKEYGVPVAVIDNRSITDPGRDTAFPFPEDFLFTYKGMNLLE